MYHYFNSLHLYTISGCYIIYLKSNFVYYYSNKLIELYYLFTKYQTMKIVPPIMTTATTITTAAAIQALLVLVFST